ncbi:MAG: hypothetical protein AAGK09_08740 [Planctomycetota bacterium]
MLFDLQDTDAAHDFPWLAGTLSRIDAAARSFLQTEDVLTPDPVPIFVFHTPWQYADFLRQHGLPAGGRGVYFRVDRGCAVAAFTDGIGEHQLASVLLHEGLHAMVDATFPNPIPHWLNEGMAQCLGDLWLREDGQTRTLLDPMRLRRLRTLIDDHPPVSFAAVTHTEHLDWLDPQRSTPGVVLRHYDTAWALTYTLRRTKDPALQWAFTDWLTAMRLGGDADAAWRELARWLEALDIRCRRTFAQDPPPVAVNLDRLSFIAEALAVMAAHDMVMPKSIDELRHRLRILGFESAMVVPGRPKIVRPINDPANYVYLSADGDPVPFDVFPGEDRRMPPEVAAPFAPGGPSIEWRVTSQRRLSWRIAMAG